MSTPNQTREFRYLNTVLADPDPGMSPEQVKAMYAGAGYPELTNATISIAERDASGKQVITFKKGAVGTKG